jgi:hypothetical protein
MWPVAVLTIIGWFRPELRAVLSRIRKGKFLGQEIELDELQATAEAAAEAAPPMIVSPAGSASGTSSVIGESAVVEAAEDIGAKNVESEIEEVLREAARSPRIGLMLLSAKIERAARDFSADFGIGSARRIVPMSALIRQLVAAEQLTELDAEALTIFNRVRNQIVHGHDADDDEITTCHRFRHAPASHSAGTTAFALEV